VRPKPIWLAPYVIGNAGLNYTSNPALSRNGGRGDIYFVGGGGAGVRPNLIEGLYLDGHVSDQVFQYAQFSSLNFNYFNAGGGLDYVIQSLGQLTASVRFEYQRFLDSETLDGSIRLTGARFDDLELNAWLAVAEITDDTEGMAEMLATLFSTDPKSVLSSPLALFGSEEEITDRLHERRERWGYSYTVIPGDKAHAFAPIVGQQTTLTGDNAAVAGPRIDLMIARAETAFTLVDQSDTNECDLVAKGVVGGQACGYLLNAA
jgi:hypothetical protein